MVQGKITPDSYVIEKSNLKILDINKNPQDKMIVRAKEGIKIVSTPKTKREKQKLSGKQIKNLAKICIKIERHFKDPQDVEWAFEKGQFYIIQSRPITAI